MKLCFNLEILSLRSVAMCLFLILISFVDYYFENIPESRITSGLTMYVAENKCQQSRQPDYMVVFSDPVWVDDWIKYSNAVDKVGMKEMVDKERVYLVKSCTEVKILGTKRYRLTSTIGADMIEFRIMEGDFKDKKAVVFSGKLCVRSEKSPEASKQLSELEKKNAEKAVNEKKAQDKAKKEAAKDEERADDLLKAAKRWLSEGDKELALRRVDELLKRFPKSAVAEEAKKLKAQIEKK